MKPLRCRTYTFKEKARVLAFMYRQTHKQSANFEFRRECGKEIDDPERSGRVVRVFPVVKHI